MFLFHLLNANIMYKYDCEVYEYHKYVSKSSSWGYKYKKSSISQEYDICNLITYIEHLNDNMASWDEIEVREGISVANELEGKECKIFTRIINPDEEYTIKPNGVE